MRSRAVGWRLFVAWALVLTPLIWGIREVVIRSLVLVRVS
jgi:hypothetical protein